MRVRSCVDSVMGGTYSVRLRTGTLRSFDDVILGLDSLIGLLDTVHAEAVRSEAARKSLLSDISHDIRTPLTSIIGYIGALKDDIASSGEEREQYVGILDAKSRALKGMIEDIFSLAKLDADEIRISPEEIDLAELARETLIEFLPELRANGIELAAEIPDEKVMICADRLSVSRIARNLVENAIRHGGESRYVRVAVTGSTVTGSTVAGAAEAGAAEARLTVADRGKGIPQEDLPKVFTRLYRRDPARNTSALGSGLGLAIVQSLAVKNGATVSARSVPGGETSFEVLFRTKKTI